MQLRTVPGALALFVISSVAAVGCETHKAGKEERIAAPPPPKVIPTAIADQGARGADEQPDPPELEPPAGDPADAVAVAGAAGPSCEDAAANVLEIIASSVKAQAPEQLPMFEAQKEQVRSQFIGQCKADGWSAEARACVLAARSESDLQPCQDLLPNKQGGGPPPAPPPAVADTPPAVPSPPPGDAPGPPVDRGGPPCDQVARNVAVLVRRVQDVPEAQMAGLVDNIAGMCTQSGWSRQVKECFAAATRPDELTECQRYANVEAQAQ